MKEKMTNRCKTRLHYGTMNPQYRDPSSFTLFLCFSLLLSHSFRQSLQFFIPGMPPIINLQYIAIPPLLILLLILIFLKPLLFRFAEL